MSELNELSLLPPGTPDRSDLLTPAIKKSRGLRQPPVRSKGSKMGAIVCPVTNRIIWTESGIEHMAVQHNYADVAVATVTTQALKIKYRNAEGESGDHILDVLVLTHSGKKHGQVVKHSSKAAKMRLCDFIELLAGYTRPEDADTLSQVTERDLPEFHIRNAAHFLSVRQDQRTVFDSLVREAAPMVTEPTVLRAFMAQFGGGEFAFRPALRAIFFGTFNVLTQGLIDGDSVIQFSGKVMPDLDEERRNPLPR